MTTATNARAYPAQRQAREMLARLDANVSAFFDHEIDYATFHANQGPIWDAVVSAGPRVRDLVNAALLERIRAHGIGAAAQTGGAR